jgi:hypothetical protein
MYIQFMRTESDAPIVQRTKKCDAIAEHVWRSKGLIRQITAWKPNAKRSRGRPRQR